MKDSKGRQFSNKGEPMSNFAAHLSKDSASVQGDLFLLLRNKTRLRILDLLSRYGGLLCVVEIAEVLEEAPSVISSHLALLRGVNLVSREMHATFAYYTLNVEELDQYRQFLEQYSPPHGVSM